MWLITCSALTPTIMGIMLRMRWMEFHGPEHGLWILDEARMWLMFEKQLMEK